MPKMKPFEAIASRFHVSAESAKYFLGRVQKSFKKDKPPQQLIVDFMHERRFKALPEPHVVATLMSEAGAWTAALQAAPPVLPDDEDPYFNQS